MVQGMQGDLKMVNGGVTTGFVPNTSKVRLRILNAANSRTYMLVFSDHRPPQIITSDGEAVTLVNVPMVSTYQDSPGAMSPIMRDMGAEGFDILDFFPASNLRPSPLLHETPTTIKRRTADEAVNTRSFRLQMGTGSRGGCDRGLTTGNRNGFGGEATTSSLTAR